MQVSRNLKSHFATPMELELLESLVGILAHRAWLPDAMLEKPGAFHYLLNRVWPRRKVKGHLSPTEISNLMSTRAGVRLSASTYSNSFSASDHNLNMTSSVAEAFITVALTHWKYVPPTDRHHVGTFEHYCAEDAVNFDVVARNCCAILYRKNRRVRCGFANQGGGLSKMRDIAPLLKQLLDASEIVTLGHVEYMMTRDKPSKEELWERSRKEIESHKR